MKRLVLMLCLTAWTIGHAQERVTLDAPVKTDPGATKFRVAQLVLNVQGANLSIVLQEVTDAGEWVPGGKSIEARYEGAAALTLMRALNKADLSTRSLQQRILDRLQADGKLGAGAITGTPE